MRWVGAGAWDGLLGGDGRVGRICRMPGFRFRPASPGLTAPGYRWRSGTGESSAEEQIGKDQGAVEQIIEGNQEDESGQGKSQWRLVEFG